MAKCDKDIYGCNPDGGAKAAADEALRRMGSLSKTDKPEKSEGKDSADSHDILENLGTAKP